MNTLKAEKRSRDIKAKKLRREGYVTGNLFGRNIEGSIPLKMTEKEVGQILKTETRGGQILLDVEGQIYDVLIKEIDLAPMGTKVNEIDFQELVSDKKVHSVAEIILENIDKVAEGVVQESLKEVAYKAYPSALVEKIRVDVSHMKIGDVIRVRDLEIAEDQDVELKTSLDAVVASVLAVHNNIESTDEETEDTTLETV